ncbi:DEAD/DEAH box helicase [Streptomyces niveus]|uniref:DEAD/DEAH box helicase n=1 Tax=Streptomyces niveus TaxID=193462 RepID=UPI0036DE0996
MYTVADLATHGASPQLLDVWSQKIQALTDVQERAVRAGALDGRTNLLVMAPTSSGKTFVGEMAASQSAFSSRQHSIFIVPFRALADEHYETFRERYEHVLSVVISTSDWSEYDDDIRAGNFNLAVMTYEKLIAFLAQQPDLIERCTTLVVDEVQLISEGDRGAKLEALLTQVLNAENPPQIVALSASVDGVNGLDRWLGATMVSSVERPVPLFQSVCSTNGSSIQVNPDGSQEMQTLTSSQHDKSSLLLELCRKFVSDGRQVIVFRTTVRQVAETARALRENFVASGLSNDIDQQFNALDDSDAVNDLRLCISSGVGYHTGDLTHAERRLAEETFRSGEIQVLVSTTTLAMGVNLPSDVVIVADSVRFSPAKVGWSRTNISVAEYRNSAGRAGRLGKRSAGYAVLLAEHPAEQMQLVNAYLLGKVEPIRSQIPNRPLSDTVFDIVCSDLAHSEEEVVQFVTSTFAYPTYYERVGGGLQEVRRQVTDAVTKCLNSGLVLLEEGRLYPTPLAKVFGASGISLASSVGLARVLQQATVTQLTKADITFEIASCPESGIRPWLRRRYKSELDPRPDHAPSKSLCASGSRLSLALSKRMPSTDEQKSLVRAKCLLDWMSGKNQRAISRDFEDMGAASARVRELGKNSAWIFETLATAAEVNGSSAELVAGIKNLALESRYGLPAPLAPLARLGVPGISRDHLLKLHNDTSSAVLYDPETILDEPDEAFDGMLTTLQLDRLRRAIITDLEDSLRRKRAGHVARSIQTDLPQKTVDDLYISKAEGLEQAVTDALTYAGISATRVLRQPHGEEDIRIAHTDGTVVVSVTASREDTRPIKWNKAKEILGAGTGLNPINYICIGRPGFEGLAERSASNIARETGTRSILLIPVPVLAESLLLVAEGVMDRNRLADILAHKRGILAIDDLPGRDKIDVGETTQE